MLLHSNKKYKKYKHKLEEFLSIKSRNSVFFLHQFFLVVLDTKVWRHSDFRVSLYLII